MTDPQVRQLAEQRRPSEKFFSESKGGEFGDIAYNFDDQQRDWIFKFADAFASHTRREALREAASLTCGCCAIDGDPEDWINKSTATPAGDDGGPRFVHVYPDGTTIECGTQEIWAAIRLLAEEKK